MDSYADCPCGSGKKVKFCCQKIVPEMEKIERLQENQPDLALQHLNKLAEKHPGNPWIVTTSATICLQRGEYQAAKIELLKFLKDHPDHMRANALYALAALNADGLPQAKKALHRAFKRSITDNPSLVSLLMESLGEYHLLSGHVMAARAHFVLAARLAPEGRERAELIRIVMHVDSDKSIPFPLRGGHHIPAYEGPESVQPSVDKARRLSLVACWEEAADLLEEVVKEDPQSPELWHMIGLFRAWDGEESAAAQAFHQAASLYQDRAKAVECETLAQLLERHAPESTRSMRLNRFQVSSVSQLLTRLDEEPLFARSDGGFSMAKTPEDPVATYLLLDRPIPDLEELGRLMPEQVPLYHGRVLLFDSSEEDDFPASAFVVGLEGEDLDRVMTEFQRVAGELAQPVSPEESDAPASSEQVGSIPLDELPLHRNYFVPPRTPGDVRRQIELAHWESVLETAWPETARQALGGKSPVQAAGDESLSTALMASVYLLDAFFDERSKMLPISKVLEKVGLTVEPLDLEPEASVATLSAFDLLRLDLTKLTDDQLDQLADRLVMARHARLLGEVLEEFLKRDLPAGSERRIAPENMMAMLMDLSADDLRPEDALAWSAKGQEFASGSGQADFEQRLTWKLRELRVLVSQGSTAQLEPLLVELWETYGRKLPGLRDQLNEVVATLNIPAPWEKTIITADSVSGESGWSAGEVESSQEPAKKLWLPGQD